jgi:putative addiction module antidote
MNRQLKITRIGNSAGIILTKDVLAHLETGIGTVLSVAKTPRGIELSVPESDFDDQMAVARAVMVRRKRALQELAK